MASFFGVQCERSTHEYRSTVSLGHHRTLQITVPIALLGIGIFFSTLVGEGRGNITASSKTIVSRKIELDSSTRLIADHRLIRSRSQTSRKRTNTPRPPLHKQVFALRLRVYLKYVHSLCSTSCTRNTNHPHQKKSIPAVILHPCISAYIQPPVYRSWHVTHPSSPFSSKNTTSHINQNCSVLHAPDTMDAVLVTSVSQASRHLQRG